MQTDSDTRPNTRKREEHLSPDSQWRSFPKVPHLLQYVSNGNYYGRIKVGGKVIRESLKTTVWTTAKLRLTDFLKGQQEARGRVAAPKFSEAVTLFERDLESDTTIKPRSKEYRLLCLKKIETSWPGLWDLRLDEIPAQACKDWSAELSKGISSHYYNNTIATLRQVLTVGIKAHKATAGVALENPAVELKRVRVKQKDLQLPEPSHFRGLVENLRKGSGAWGQRVADLVQFLAFSGLRIRSEAIWVTWEDVDWQRRQIIVRGHPETGTKNSELRRIPILPDMELLLTSLKEKLGSADMIKNFDLEELAGAHKVAGDFDVGLGRSWVTAGVVVRQNDGSGGGYGIEESTRKAGGTIDPAWLALLVPGERQGSLRSIGVFCTNYQ